MGRGGAGAPQTLVNQCVDWVKARIDTQVLRPGACLPSIRRMAGMREVSPFTVAEAYARLVASGEIEARRGSGFYVRQRIGRANLAPRAVGSRIELSWLISHMLDSATARGPGLGVLPASWLHTEQIGAALRAVGRQSSRHWYGSATARGFAPLLALLQQRLADLNILAQPEQLLLTTGTTHALDLVLRALVRPDDPVLTLAPCWFGALGMLEVHRARVLGVPCTPAGPDLEALENLVRLEKPRLLIISSAAHNPTGLSLTRAAVVRIVAMANQHGFAIFEDDVYADLCDSSTMRLAAADELKQVIYAGSFSKTLASNIRVGFVACRAGLAQAISTVKVLSGFTTPEINERIVHKILIEGHYKKHVAMLRARLEKHRQRTSRLLADAGAEIFGGTAEGMFLWANMRTDTDALAIAGRAQDLLLAPGSLFSTHQTPTHWMRVNVTCPTEELMSCLRLMQRAPDSGHTS